MLDFDQEFCFCFFFFIFRFFFFLFILHFLFFFILSFVGDSNTWDFFFLSCNSSVTTFMRILLELLLLFLIFFPIVYLFLKWLFLVVVVVDFPCFHDSMNFSISLSSSACLFPFFFSIFFVLWISVFNSNAAYGP